ncbi:MerC mercury resistance protein [Novipirellula aureliae]|uniref:MerC mercury resistance protein n=1 Tax=Novipirellula aureliae TaxID=2527966 RepID=A0A5C6E7Q6_9BACT|nr:MerC domain-containing protein [Novipirellula aureliae]TWU44838.1 MerC mercury resistance protein [Novipirellula aureliae]
MPTTTEPHSISTHGLPTTSEAIAGTTPRWQDGIGIAASIGCAIHCAAMPFVISFLPALGLSFLADESFHRWMAFACFVIALAAFVPGFRQHRRWMPGAIAVAGLSLLTIAAFGIVGDCCAACNLPGTPSVAAAACTDACCESCAAGAMSEQVSSEEFTADIATASVVTPGFLAHLADWITPLGGMLLVSAHLLNHRYGCVCRCCRT